jgi:hypothetical protein
VRFSHRRVQRFSSSRSKGGGLGIGVRKKGWSSGDISRNYTLTRGIVVEILFVHELDSGFNPAFLSHQHCHGLVDISDFIIQLAQLCFDILDFRTKDLKTIVSIIIHIHILHIIAYFVLAQHTVLDEWLHFSHF